MTKATMINFVMAIMFLAVAIIKFRSGQAEHFWTRFIASLWFGFIAVTNKIPDSLSHTLSVSIIIIILAVEITSPLFRVYWRGRK
jgi:hypothetical protein